MMFRNKFNSKCNTCQANLSPGMGWCQKEYNQENNTSKYQAYCDDHATNKPQPASNSPRTCDQNGILKVNMIAEPLENQYLLKSLNGAIWQPKLGNDTWKVSTKPQHLNRLINVLNRTGVHHNFTDPLNQNALNAPKNAFPFQIEGINWLSKQTRALLADDMGLGKSMQTLLSLENNAKTLIVCPSGLKLNWKNETQKWRPDLQPIILKTKKDTVNNWLPKENQVVIISYDILNVEENIDMKDITLIVDEAHAVANNKTKRSQNIKILAKNAKKCWFLTGTPMLNRPEQLYAVLNNGGMFETAFKDYNKFLKLFGARTHWIKPDEDKEQEDKPKKSRKITNWKDPSPETPELLRRVMLRRTKQEVLPQLPNKIYSTIEVEIDQNLKDALQNTWNEYEEWFQNHPDDLPNFEKFAIVRKAIAAAKTIPALEIVEEYEENDTPLLVFSAHKYPTEQIGKREGWAIINGDTSNTQRQKIVDDFQNGKLKGIAATIKAGGVGLNLTYASNQLFIDLDWTPVLNLQAEDRTCRIGQTANKIEIIQLVATDCKLDQHVTTRIQQKMEKITQTVEYQNGGIKVTSAA